MGDTPRNLWVLFIKRGAHQWQLDSAHGYPEAADRRKAKLRQKGFGQMSIVEYAPTASAFVEREP